MEYEITVSINGVQVSMEEYRRHDFSRSTLSNNKRKTVEIKEAV
nr:MAG TPA: hypothetical protein [Caudoviricetes sp.]